MKIEDPEDYWQQSIEYKEAFQDYLSHYLYKCIECENYFDDLKDLQISYGQLICIDCYEKFVVEGESE